VLLLAEIRAAQDERHMIALDHLGALPPLLLELE